MWYYIAGVILVSHVADILTVGEKIYKVCNGVYNVASISKNYIFPKTKKYEYMLLEDDESEWIELKLFKNEECQTDNDVEITEVDVSSI